MWSAEYRELRGLYETHKWTARAGRHTPGVSPERKREIEVQTFQLFDRYRQVFPHDNREIFEMSEAYRASIAALEAEGFSWVDAME